MQIDRNVAHDFFFEILIYMKDTAQKTNTVKEQNE